MEPREERQAAGKLVKLRLSVLDDRLWNKRNQFGGLVAETLICELEHEVSTEATMHQMLIMGNLMDAFPNVEVLLCLYLTLIISNVAVVERRIFTG